MPKKHEAGLKDRLALAMARGRNPTAAAKSLGLNERTARQWARDPAFRDRVLRTRNQILGRAAGRLAALATKAASTLGKLLDSGNEEVRLKAARAILADSVAVSQPTRLAEKDHILADEYTYMDMEDD